MIIVDRLLHIASKIIEFHLWLVTRRQHEGRSRMHPILFYGVPEGCSLGYDDAGMREEGYGELLEAPAREREG